MHALCICLKVHMSRLLVQFPSSSRPPCTRAFSVVYMPYLSSGRKTTYVLTWLFFVALCASNCRRTLPSRIPLGEMHKRRLHRTTPQRLQCVSTAVGMQGCLFRIRVLRHAVGLGGRCREGMAGLSSPVLWWMPVDFYFCIPARAGEAHLPVSRRSDQTGGKKYHRTVTIIVTLGTSAGILGRDAQCPRHLLRGGVGCQAS